MVQEIVSLDYGYGIDLLCVHCLPSYGSLLWAYVIGDVGNAVLSRRRVDHTLL